MANPSISLYGATYSGVTGVTLPTPNSETATFPWVEGSQTISQNGTYDVSALEEVVVNVSGGGGTPAISVVDTTDSHGGTVRTITALDISNSTLTTADQLSQGVTAYNKLGVLLTGTGGGGGGATQHTIHLEFTDSTDTDIEVDYDDALIATMITSYDPVTYGGKTVDSAALDNVIWYQRQTETWETIYDNDMSWFTDNDNDYPYCWVSLLSDVSIPNGSVWRITFDNVQYRCTAAIDSTFGVVTLGNPKWGKGTDDGTNVPFCFTNQGWGAWTGSLNKPNTDAQYHFLIERLVTA